MTVVSLKIINPVDSNGDDKINDPAATAYNPNDINSASGNEFTFSSETVGELIVPVRVQVSVNDPRVYSQLGSVVMVKISDDDPAAASILGTSKLSWDNSLPGLDNIGWATYIKEDKDNGIPAHYRAVATFTGLPENNTDFGKKIVTVGAASASLVHMPLFALPAFPVFEYTTKTAEFEVFFPKEAKNHPYKQGDQGETPNWYYYWQQIIPQDQNAVRTYRKEGPANHPYGTTRIYTIQPSVTEIHEQAGQSFNQCMRTLRHENSHVFTYYTTVWFNLDYSRELDEDRDGLRDNWEKTELGKKVLNYRGVLETRDWEVKEDKERFATWSEEQAISAEWGTVELYPAFTYDWANPGTNYSK